MEEHQWSHIWKGAIPSSIAVVLIFANITSRWRWALLLAAVVAAYGIVYLKTKKKADVFTAGAIVVLVGLAMEFLVRMGII